MSQLLGRAGVINWVFLSDSSVAGARQMLSRCSVCWSGEACFSHSGAYRSRVLNAEMDLKRQNGRSITAKAAKYTQNTEWYTNENAAIKEAA